MAPLLTLLAGAAFGARYWDPDALVADAFPAGETRPVRLHLTDADRAALRARLGRPVPKADYDFVEVCEGGVVVGYVLVDEQKGQHEPITFAVVLSPEAVVLRQEVVVYRERYGHEVTDPRFRAQFVGKTAADPLRPGRDVEVVSGATISSVAMATGVKRAAALAAVLVARGEPGAP